jgi:hypothetical protein
MGEGSLQPRPEDRGIRDPPHSLSINAYVFKFMARSITGRLVEKNGNFITIELKSGSVIVAHIDSLMSIWNIRQTQEMV